eukprot:gene10830-11984_t
MMILTMNSSNITPNATPYHISNIKGSLHVDQLWLLVIHTLALLLLMLAIMIGNALEIYCLLHIKDMRTVSGMFIMNLAVTDLCVGLISIPLSLASSLRHELLHFEWFCILNGSGFMLFLIASILTMALISIQKYTTIVLYRSARGRFSKRHARYSIAAIWVIAVAMVLAPAAGWGTYTYTTGGHQCAPYATNGLGLSYLVTMIIVMFIVPVACMSYCYLKLYLFTRNHIHTVGVNCRTASITINRAGIQTNRTTGQQSISEARMIHTLIIIMLVFLACWLPCALFYIVKMMGVRVARNYESLLIVCAYSNSALNPIIYALRHEAFRRGFRNIIGNALSFIWRGRGRNVVASNDGTRCGRERRQEQAWGTTC